MGLKAFFIDCGGPVLPQVALSLKKNQGWQPLYWTASSELEAQVRELFPGVVFHDTLAAARGIPPDELNGLLPCPPDAALLRALAPHENQVLKMMDRMGAGTAFTLDERLELYHRYLGYWQAVLEHYQPEAVVFSFAPHLIYDYVVYLLCRLRKIPTVMFEFAPPLPRFLFVQQGFDLGIPGVEKLYQSKLAAWDGGPVEVSPYCQKYLDQIESTYAEGSPWYQKAHLNKAEQFASAYTWKSLASYLVFPWRLARLVRKSWDFLFAPPPPNYFKVPGKRLDEKSFSGLGWRLHRQRRRRHKRRMARYYQRLARRVPLDLPYVLVALHFQPERTTAPLGERFVDQLLMIRLLSRWLPDGWRLYVKEAPAYFFPHVTKQFSRTRDFYDQIAALPNAELVSMEYDPFSLVDSARAVATVTGTMGWEAVLRGKPSLIFGHPWYRGCEGVYWAGEEDSCRRALSEIEAGARPDRDKVLLFLQVMEELSLGAFLEERMREKVPVDEQDNIKRLAAAITRMVRSQKQADPV